MRVSITNNRKYDEYIEKMFKFSDILHQEGIGLVNAKVNGECNNIVGEGSANQLAGHLRLNIDK